MDPQDLIDRNNMESHAKGTRFQGYKLGKVRGVFTATGGLATGAYKLVGNQSEALVIPKGATIRQVVYKVLTTFASGTSAATIALSCVAANDIVSAAAISTNVWNSGIPVVTIPVVQTLSTWLHTTADSSVTATVAVEAVTAGKLVAFIDYIYWGDIGLT